MPLLVKFSVIGDVRFRNKAEELPLVAHGGAVVKLVAEGKGEPGQEQKVERRGFPKDLRKRRKCAGEQRFLQEKIASASFASATMRAAL